MLNNPSNIKRDLRSIIAKDEENNRQLQIKLENKFNPISQAKWREKQSELYLNTLIIKNNPSLGQLLANDLESNNQNDPMMVSQISMSLLLTITENQIAKYIIERLTTPELSKMNQYWPQIVRDLKKNNLKLNKDAFISKMKSKEDNVAENVPVQINDQNNNDQNNYNNNDQNNENNNNQNNDYEEIEKNRKPDDRLIEDDEIDGIRPFPIGDISTTKYIYNILNEPTYVYLPETENEVQLYANVSDKLKDKKIRKSDYISYIERRIDRNIISSKYTRPQLKKVAIDIGFLHLKYWSDNVGNEDLENVKKSGGKIMKGKKKRKIIGRGISEPNKLFINKFTVDLEKLKRNILNVKYTSCRGSVPNMKIERVSEDVKSVLLDILQNKYNSKLFDKLLSDDQRIVSHFVRTLKIKNIDMDNFDKKYQHEYEVLLGEVNCGNSNEQIKKKLKQYILRGISENLIPIAQGLNQILNL